MGTEEIIRKRLKKLKAVNPDIANQLERELIRLSDEYVKIKTVKKKRHALR